MSWDEDVDRLVGDSLRVLRKNADLTQGELAERLGQSVPMSQQTIAKIESGSRSLRLSEAVAIIQALDNGEGTLRLEHLVASPAELVIESEAQRIADEILAAADRLSAAAKDLTLWTLVGQSFIEDEPDADGRASHALRAFTRDGATGLFNVVKAGIREALEEGGYADEATYRDTPEYAKPFLSVVAANDDPAT